MRLRKYDVVPGSSIRFPKATLLQLMTDSLHCLTTKNSGPVFTRVESLFPWRLENGPTLEQQRRLALSIHLGRIPKSWIGWRVLWPPDLRVTSLEKRGILMAGLCKTEITRIAALGLQYVRHLGNPGGGAEKGFSCGNFNSLQHRSSPPYLKFVAHVKALDGSVSAGDLGCHMDLKIDRQYLSCHEEDPAAILATAAEISSVLP